MNNFPYYLGWWAGSLSSYVPTLPLFGILWIWTRSQSGVLRVIPLLFWLAAWTLMVVACEVALKTVTYIGPNADLSPNPAGSWGFGQVISVVMLFSQFWDIVFYPLGLSTKHRDAQGKPYRRWTWWYERHLKGTNKDDLKEFFRIVPLTYRSDGRFLAPKSRRTYDKG